MPLDHQTAFELRYAEQLSLEEVAEALGVSLATVKRYVASARSSLAQLLGARDAELGDAETKHVAEAYRQG